MIISDKAEKNSQETQTNEIDEYTPMSTPFCPCNKNAPLKVTQKKPKKKKTTSEHEV